MTIPEKWIVIGKQDGAFPPKWRPFISSFGVCDSRDAALDAVRIKVSFDPFFRRKHAGWNFYVVNGDYCIRVNKDGQTWFDDRNAHEEMRVLGG